MRDIDDIPDRLRIQKFQDFDKVNPVIHIIGKNNSGSSYVIQNLIEKLNKSDDFENNLLIISPAEGKNPLYSLAYPKCTLLHEYNENVLREYLVKVANMKKTNKEQFRDFFSGCIILDNCLTKDCLNDPVLCELLINSRHHHTAVVININNPLFFNPSVRWNVDFVFLMNNNNNDNQYQKLMWKCYGRIIPKFSTFKNIYGQITYDSKCMVIKNCGPGNDALIDKLFYL